LGKQKAEISDYNADGKGGPGTGKHDPPEHTMRRGWRGPKSPRYSGFQGLFGVRCLRLQRLVSSVGFGTGTRMAPRKNLRALCVTCRERAALPRTRVPRRAVPARTRGTRMWGHWFLHKIPLSPRGTSGERAGKRGISIKRTSFPPPSPPFCVRRRAPGRAGPVCSHGNYPAQAEIDGFGHGIRHCARQRIRAICPRQEGHGLRQSLCLGSAGGAAVRR
jgi:hypothetical protein